MTTLELEGRREQQPRPPRRSHNERLETVFEPLRRYLNREYTLPCTTTPLYVAPDVPADVIEDALRVIITPNTHRGLDTKRKRLVRVRASAQENGRVLETDEPINIVGKEYVVSCKGGGATGFMRQGLDGFQPTMRDILGKTYPVEPRPELAAFPFSPRLGWLDKDEALAELNQSEQLTNKGLDTERIVGVFQIVELPDQTGQLQPVDFFRANGTLPEDLVPVLLVRITKENIRLQDIARLEDMYEHETAGKLLEYAKEAFAKTTGASQITAEEYFIGMTNKLMHGLLPLFLQGYRLASHAWQDTARNITIVGEKMDVSRFVQQPRPDLDDYPELLHNNTYFLLTMVLLRLAEQIERHSSYQMGNAPDIVRAATNQALEEVDFTSLGQHVLKKRYYTYFVKNRWHHEYRDEIPVDADELRYYVGKNLSEVLEHLKPKYQRRELSRAVFRSYPH